MTLLYSKLVDGTEYEYKIMNQVQAQKLGWEQHDIEPDYTGCKFFLVGHVPEKPLPTNEEQRQARADAYTQEIDPLHAQKMRHTILGDWTDEDEAEYIEKVKTLSEEINNRYPYMENQA